MLIYRIKNMLNESTLLFNHHMVQVENIHPQMASDIANTPV